MDEQDGYIEALIELHRGLDRQGPGDENFSLSIIESLPALPPAPRIADLGCGAGAGALMLAARYRSKVMAVDLARVFLDQLADRAEKLGLAEFIETVECDIGDLGWAPGSIDLLWSEGAAYNITFAGALEAWRPLLADGGIAVISEMNFFEADVSQAASDYIANVYPLIKTESGNADLIRASGFELLEMRRLPASAWWQNYYDPLREKINRVRASADAAMHAVIDETEAEMAFFEAHQHEVGYTCFIMRAG